MPALRSPLRRRALGVGALLLVAAAVAGGLVLARRSGRTAPRRVVAAAKRNATRPVARRSRAHLAVWRATTLPAPLQDAAAAAVPAGRVLLLGGLTLADTSTSASSLGPLWRASHRVASDVALHDPRVRRSARRSISSAAATA